MANKRDLRRLSSLVRKLESMTDPIARARLAADARDVAEALIAASIAEANAAGLTWRQIGSDLGIPYQTLYRRYGAELRPMNPPSKARRPRARRGG